MSDDSGFQSKAHERLTGTRAQAQDECDRANVPVIDANKFTEAHRAGVFKSAADKLADATTVKDLQGLLSLHDDERTTAVINREWDKLRKAVDYRANMDEADVTGEMTITIKYKAISVSGIKEITIPTPDLKFPKEKPNTRKLYESANGELRTVAPTKQTEMFDNVRPISRK